MIPLIGISLVSLVLGMILIAFSRENAKLIGVVFSGIAMLAIISALAMSLLSGTATFTEQYYAYITTPNIVLSLGFNAITFTLALMAVIVAFVTQLSGNTEREGYATSSALILLFELAAIGLFASTNLFVFFIFWDVGVVALFFMLYLLGSANRRRAAMKFLMYEILASLLLLFAIMLIYFYTPLRSFDIGYITANAFLIPHSTEILIFTLLFIAFLINMPVFPVHLWLPDAHTEASTQGSMLLSGILTKFGGYGMILAFTMLPVSGSFAVFTLLLGAFSAFYLAFVLFTQTDIKRIVAYTTIIEMSIVLIGIASLSPLGIAGATFAMLAHGFTISLLFLAAGSTGHIFGERDIRLLHGVVRNAHSTAYSFLTGVFATTGMPLTAAFIGDLLIFVSAYRSFSTAGIIPLAALIIMGAYLYYVINKSLLSTKESTKSIDYIGATQKIGYAVLLFCIFLFGIAPFIILKLFNL